MIRSTVSEQDVTTIEGITELSLLRPRFAVFLAGLLLAVFCGPIAAAEVHFDIPSSTADESLTLFAEQAEVTVIVPYDQARTITTPSLIGHYSVNEGIDILLRGTPLSGKMYGDQLVIKIDNPTDKDVTMTESPNTETPNAIKSRKGIIAALLGVFAASGGGGTTANAQQEPTVREEIIVTAQKREMSLQEVPVSVSAITEDTIIKQAVVNFEDYARGIAGVSFTQNGRFARGGNIATIRGIANIGLHPVNAFMIDESPLQPQEFERVGMPDPNMFDIQRVEVLRGPQGDIYGSSSMGGVIKVITNKPDASEFDARVAGNLTTIKDGGESYEVSGMVNIPIVEDEVALRLVAQQMTDGGFIDLVAPEDVASYRAGGNVSLDKDANEADTTVIRAALAWQITDNLRITPSIFYQDVQEDRARYIATDLSRETGNLVDIDFGYSEFADNEFTNTNLLIEYDTEYGTFISSTSFFKLEWSNSLGAQGIPCNFFGTCGDSTATLDDVGEEEQLIQEVRFASSLEGPFNFIIGGFYRDVEDDFAQFSTAASLLPVVGTDLIFLKEGEVETVEETAVFGQATWQFNEQWEGSLGLRWYDYERDRLTPTAFGLFGFPERKTGAKEDGVLPTVGLRWTPNDDAMVYGRYAEGFRPGFGFATIFPPPCDPELERLGINPDSGVGQVDADSVETYEIGAKTTLADGAVTINGALYHTDWNDIHARIGLLCGFALDQNAGTAEVDGAEIEITATLENLDLSLAIGYTDASFSEDVPAIGAENGEVLPGVAEWTVGASAQYNFSAFGGEAYVRADYSHTDEQSLTAEVANPLEAAVTPAINLLGLRFGVDFDDWQVAVYAKNALDEDEVDLCGRDITFRNTRPETSTCALKPREIGVYFSKSFN